ncbi:unnamed protein product, partial [Rotaria sp. Silwood1]
EIFDGNQYKLIYSDYQYKRTSNQINPKLNTKNKLNKCSHQDLYSLIWTIYALAKTIYPSTINDLIASFHLLLSSCCLNDLCSNGGSIIDKLLLYAHSDKYHDFNWILHVYSLDAYCFLKIIPIFLKTCTQISKSKSFIKYLSSIEENILSSMTFSTKSSLRNDIELKSILSYKTISSIQSNINNSTPMFIQSPNKTNVSRKLFQSNTTDQ